MTERGQKYGHTDDNKETVNCLALFGIFYSYLQAYVTCPVGIFMVGYCMIAYGVCGGITSFMGGKLTKYIGRIPLIVAGKYYT